MFGLDAYLLVQGALIVTGTEAEPVVLEPLAERWKGLYVVGAPNRSVIKNAIIRNTDYFDHGALKLSGGVNFYRADVDLENVDFRGSTAEDALNIIESDFDIKRSSFVDCRSDAFDSDYSTGRIRSTTFARIGGDGFDTSGTNAQAHELSFEEIGDKGISAGEGSTLSVSGMRADHVGTPIVSKDGSNVRLSGFEAANYRVFAAMAYRKKPLYGESSLRINGTAVPITHFRAQTGNTLEVNRRVVEPVPIDVDALYSSGPMNKL